jgi:A/G-specific adenine glycosylase
MAQTTSRALNDRAWLRRRVLAWFRRHGRSFPWRETEDPYRILIAELLLQRTRADNVARLYPRFIARFPTPQALARADTSDVESLLRPLGFAHRTRRLPELAGVLVEDYDGLVPATEQELLALPGVGPYVANAVLTLAYHERRPLVDPNVIRLIDRAVAIGSTRPRPRDDPRLSEALAILLPPHRAREFSLGLIDLGALICTARPRCGVCPLRGRCSALRAGRVVPRAD